MYGRNLEGRQRADIVIGYVYHAFYQAPGSTFSTFAQLSGVPLPLNETLSEVEAREEITIEQHCCPKQLMTLGHPKV